MTALTATALLALLEYEPRTGLFRWKTAMGPRARIGSVAGTVSEQGYIRIGINGTYHRAHRLAWLYTHGEWPTSAVDHINGNRADNRIANLREASAQANSENLRVAHGRSKTGFLGVWPLGSRFRAGIRHKGKAIELGTFDTPQEAQAAYLAAKANLHSGFVGIAATTDAARHGKSWVSQLTPRQHLPQPQHSRIEAADPSLRA